jgi:allantoinase
MAERPAKLAGLAHKGTIALRGDADLCVFAPDAAFVVDVQRLAYRNPVSPYDRRALWGGSTDVAARARIDVSGPPAGRLLRRGAR